MAYIVVCDAKLTKMLNGVAMRVEEVQSPPTIVAPLSTISDEEAAAMFRAAVNLFALWKVTDKEAAVLLDLPVRSYARWKTGTTAHWSRDLKARLSNLMGIHKALRIIFQEPQRGYDWIRVPNTVLSGRSALSVMLDGDLTDLMRVRRYLDAERGGW
jgi:uncharacterized protein (DUF2384 family)